MAPAGLRALSKIGHQGERIAADYLRERGYHVLERNFRCPGGEVDLIALDGSTLVFVEVKLRRSLSRGSPFEAVTALKQGRVRKAAQVYLSYSGRVFHRIRFDVIALVRSKGQTDITHLQSSFG